MRRAAPWVWAPSRLRTISWSAEDWETIVGAGPFDLVQLHGYVLEWAGVSDAVKQQGRDGVGLMVDLVERAYRSGRPFCFGELGYQGTEEHNPGNDGDPDGLLLRQQLWAGFMLGGYGGGMNWWWDVYIDSHQLWDCYRGFAAVVKRLDWRERGLEPIAANRAGAIRVIGWSGPTQGLLWAPVS